MASELGSSKHAPKQGGEGGKRGEGRKEKQLEQRSRWHQGSLHLAYWICVVEFTNITI